MNAHSESISSSRTLNSAQRASLRKYWRSNLKLMFSLLAVWATVSFGCGVLFADTLNVYKLWGTEYPLGFWFAQQGSIFVFIFLILIYAIVMNRIDDKHCRELEGLNGAS